MVRIIEYDFFFRERIDYDGKQNMLIIRFSHGWLNNQTCTTFIALPYLDKGCPKE